MQELVQLLRAGETQETLIVELLQNVREPVVRREFMAQLDQRLHNMLAGAVSLVDHTRRIISTYPQTGFSREFEAKNGLVVEQSVSQFLRRFRNYLLHYGQAPITLKGSLAPDLTGEVLLDCADLLKWDGWTAKSRAFLDANRDGIRLGDACVEYEKLMRGLYEWIFFQFESLHVHDTAQLNELVKARNLTLTGGLYGTEEEWRHFIARVERLRRQERESSGGD